MKKYELTENQIKTIFDKSFYGTGLLRVRIGRKDINNIDIKSGDVIEIVVCKAKPNLSQSEVFHKGVVAMHNTAFCVIMEDGVFNPIINYADYCSAKIVGSVNDTFNELG